MKEKRKKDKKKSNHKDKLERKRHSSSSSTSSSEDEWVEKKPAPAPNTAERRKRHSSSSSTSSSEDEWVEKKSAPAPNTAERRKRHSSTSSTSSSEDEWVEKKSAPAPNTAEREDWMAMTGVMKTYTKDDIRKPKQEERKHIDSYNPSTSSRELNPYWKDGGGGLPQTPESFRKSRQFMKPDTASDLYSKHSSSREAHYEKDYVSKSSHYSHGSYSQKLSGWRRESKKEYPKQDSREDNRRDKKENRTELREDNRKKSTEEYVAPTESNQIKESLSQNKSQEKIDTPYLTDEKMNKLAAKIVKAEIMGNTSLVNELKAKLEAAREYRKQNPNAGKEEDDGVMLMSTNSMGNSRPLVKASHGDPRSKGGKRKAETHSSGERMKYFGNDDKYDLAQMFQQEKYGNNYDEEAELAKVASKHKNPNDDLEDIFTEEISKNRNEAKDSEREKQRAIKMHGKMEKSLEGCEHCVDSKNMLKHLMVSCGSKVYMAVPSRKSLVKGQCLITTIQHSTCVTSVDEDVWEEIMNYRHAITNFFNSQGQDVVFFETATKLHRFPHMVIHCVPLPRDVGDMAAIYFKKALLECEAEWSMNKKVVELKGKNIRKGIPKGLPYFWIDFGMDPGFAHVIEDQQLFPRNFAEEVIGGILDLDHNLWKNPQREYGDLQRKKVLEFIKEWKPFDIAKNQ